MNPLDAEDSALDLDPFAEGTLQEPTPPADARGIPSGTQLRHRLITAEALAAMDAEVAKPSFLQRIFGNK